MLICYANSLYTFSISICLLLHIEAGALYWQSREETQICIVSEQDIYIQCHILWNIQFPLTFNRTDKRMKLRISILSIISKMLRLLIGTGKTSTSNTSYTVNIIRLFVSFFLQSQKYFLNQTEESSLIIHKYYKYFIV